MILPAQLQGSPIADHWAFLTEDQQAQIISQQAPTAPTSALSGIYQAPTYYAPPVQQPVLPPPPGNLAEAIHASGTVGPGGMPGQSQMTGAPASPTAQGPSSFAGDAFMGIYSPTNNWRCINPQQLPPRSTLTALRQHSPLVDLYSGLFSLGGQNPDNAWATFQDYLPRGNVPGLSSFR